MWLLSPDTKVVSISITITWNKQYQMTNLPFESRSSYPLTSDTLSMVAICITISQQSRRLARGCPKWLWSLCATNSNIGLGRILADLQERSRHEELRDSKQRWRRMKARTKRKTSTSTNTCSERDFSFRRSLLRRWSVGHSCASHFSLHLTTSAVSYSSRIGLSAFLAFLLFLPF